MFEEKLEKIYDGYVEGTGIRKVVWRKTVDASPDIQREVGKRFNFSIQAFSGKKVLVIGLGTLLMLQLPPVELVQSQRQHWQPSQRS